MQFTTTCSADCVGWSERFVAAAVRRWFPISLQHHRGSLGCVHPHNEGFHRGLLPQLGPSVRSAPLACPRSQCLSLVWFFHCHCHCHTLLPFTCVPDFLSCIARGSDPRFLNCADQTFCWMRNSVFSFLCELVFLLNGFSSSLVAVHSLSAECGRLC